MYKYFLENKHEFMKLVKKEVESRSSWLIDKENPHMSDVKSGNIINFLDHISELGNKKIIYEKFKNHSFIPKTFVNTLPTKQDVYFIKNVKRDSARGLYVVNNVKDIKLNSNFLLIISHFTYVKRNPKYPRPSPLRCIIRVYTSPNKEYT